MTAYDEVTTLLAYLDAQRRHVLGIIEGLDDEQLRRPVLPSGWSCLGMVRHLALDDERFWFQAVIDGDRAVIDEITAGADDAWQVPEGETTEQLLDLYREQIEISNTLVNARSPEQAPAWWPEFFGDFRLDSLREVILHVTTETATHAGHLDAARELIDGRRWLVLD